MGIIRWAVVEDGVGNIVLHSRRWPPIEEVCGRGKSFSPIGGRHVCVDKMCSAYVVQGANDMFVLAIQG